MGHLLGIITAISLCVSTAKAQDDGYGALRALSANFILKACKEAPTEPQWLIGSCIGQVQMLYMLAFADGLAPNKKFCPPDGVTIEQTRNVIVRYIEDRPELMHTPFLFLAIDAVRKAWPCR